jgi:dephospho-CoA kinase
MAPQPNIALVGKAGSGKTTAAEFLVNELDYKRLSFAAPLKVMCGTATDREVLQTVGVGVRELHADAWVNLFRESLREFQVHNNDSVVVDDCRFPNEYWALKEQGFVFVQITTDRDRRIVRLRSNGKLTDEAQLEHVSETSLDKLSFDYRIRNIGTVEELHDELRWVLDCEARRT